MKRNLLMIVALVALVVLVPSCQKEHLLQEVSINYEIIEGHSMVTKAVANNDVLDLIESCLPKTSIELKLTSKTTGEVYKVKTGVAATLPLDSYSVKATIKGSANLYINGSSIWMSQEPSFIVDDELTIKSTQRNYVVDATFSSYAIVIDYAETKKAQVLSYANNSAWKDIDFVASGDIGIIFIYGLFDDANKHLMISVEPKTDEGWEPQQYDIYNNRNYGTMFAEYGKYYLLHPKEVTEAEGESEINFPSWGAGTL